MIDKMSARGRARAPLPAAAMAGRGGPQVQRELTGAAIFIMFVRCAREFDMCSASQHKRLWGCRMATQTDTEARGIIRSCHISRTFVYGQATSERRRLREVPTGVGRSGVGGRASARGHGRRGARRSRTCAHVMEGESRGRLARWEWRMGRECRGGMLITASPGT